LAARAALDSIRNNLQVLIHGTHVFTLGAVDGVADRRANFDAVLTAMELR